MCLDILPAAPITVRSIKCQTKQQDLSDKEIFPFFFLTLECVRGVCVCQCPSVCNLGSWWSVGLWQGSGVNLKLEQFTRLLRWCVAAGVQPGKSVESWAPSVPQCRHQWLIVAIDGLWKGAVGKHIVLAIREINSLYHLCAQKKNRDKITTVSTVFLHCSTEPFSKRQNNLLTLHKTMHTVRDESQQNVDNHMQLQPFHRLCCFVSFTTEEFSRQPLLLGTINM